MSSAEEVWPGTGPEWARSRPWPALQPAALRSTPGPQPGLAPALPLPREQGSLEALQPGLLIWSERQIEATQGASRPRGETQPQGAVEVGGRRGAVCARLPPPRPAAPPLEAHSLPAPLRRGGRHCFHCFQWPHTVPSVSPLLPSGLPLSVAGSPCSVHVVHAGGPPTSGPAGARTAGKRDILLLGWEPWGCWLVASSSPQRAVIPPGNEASVGGSRVERRGPENVGGHFVSPGSRRASMSGPFPRPRAGGLPVSPTVTRVGFVARGVTGACSGGGERCQLCTPQRLKSTPSLSSLWESERGKICGQRPLCWGGARRGLGARGRRPRSASAVKACPAPGSGG